MLNTQCADQYHSFLPYRLAVTLCTVPFSPPRSTNRCWSERRGIALTFVFCTVGDLWCSEKGPCWNFAIQFVATKKEKALCKKHALTNIQRIRNSCLHCILTIALLNVNHSVDYSYYSFTSYNRFGPGTAELFPLTGTLLALGSGLQRHIKATACLHGHYGHRST